MEWVHIYCIECVHNVEPERSLVPNPLVFNVCHPCKHICHFKRELSPRLIENTLFIPLNLIQIILISSVFRHINVTARQTDRQTYIQTHNETK